MNKINSVRFNVEWYTEVSTSRVLDLIVIQYYYYIRFDNDFNLLYDLLYYLPNIYNKQFLKKRLRMRVIRIRWKQILEEKKIQEGMKIVSI